MEETYTERIKKIDLIPLSQRGHIIILDKCRVEKEGFKVVYKQAHNGNSRTFNIPELNTAFLLLGNGTSITNEAMLMLAKNNVSVIFTGGGGQQAFAGIEIISLNPLNEYRPTKYNQTFAKIFFDDKYRLAFAKEFFYKRIDNIIKYSSIIEKDGVLSKSMIDFNILENYKQKIDKVNSNNRDILMIEAEFTKKLYALYANNWNIEFTRQHNKKEGVNGYLTQLNYLCYGIANVCLYALGISFSFGMFHGKTRRGALVFDVADLIKDCFAVPIAFFANEQKLSETETKSLFLEFIYNYSIIREIIQFLTFSEKFAKSLGIEIIEDK